MIHRRKESGRMPKWFWWDTINNSLKLGFYWHSKDEYRDDFYNTMTPVRGFRAYIRFKRKPFAKFVVSISWHTMDVYTNKGFSWRFYSREASYLCDRLDKINSRVSTLERASGAPGGKRG